MEIYIIYIKESIQNSLEHHLQILMEVSLEIPLKLVKKIYKRPGGFLLAVEGLPQKDREVFYGLSKISTASMELELT